MTERKVLNKYYPPDYDPSKLPRMKAGEYTRKWVQRVMAPFNMQCNTCAEYIYKGKKFNMRREMVKDEEYLGIKIWRFYMRCPKCVAEISFKTDLVNCDYAMEHGATRLFESVRLAQKMEKEAKEKEEQDAHDPMKQLEKRTKLSRKEMEELAALEELRDSNKRQARVDFDKMVSKVREHETQELERMEQEDEEFVRKLFGKSDEGLVVKRIIDSDDEEDAELPSTSKVLPATPVTLQVLPATPVASTSTTAVVSSCKPDTTDPLILSVPPSNVNKSSTSASKQRKLLLSGVVVAKKAKLDPKIDEKTEENGKQSVENEEKSGKNREKSVENEEKSDDRTITGVSDAEKVDQFERANDSVRKSEKSIDNSGLDHGTGIFGEKTDSAKCVKLKTALVSYGSGSSSSDDNDT